MKQNQFVKKGLPFTKSFKKCQKQLIRISVKLIWESLLNKQVFSIRHRLGTISLFLSWDASMVLTVIESTFMSLATVRSSFVMSVSVYPISMCPCRVPNGQSWSHRVFSLESRINYYKLQYTFKKLILWKELGLFSYQVSSCRTNFFHDNHWK